MYGPPGAVLSHGGLVLQTLPIQACKPPWHARTFIVFSTSGRQAPGQGPWPGKPTSGSYSFRRIMRGTASIMGGSLR